MRKLVQTKVYFSHLEQNEQVEGQENLNSFIFLIDDGYQARFNNDYSANPNKYSPPNVFSYQHVSFIKLLYDMSTFIVRSVECNRIGKQRMKRMQ